MYIYCIQSKDFPKENPLENLWKIFVQYLWTFSIEIRATPVVCTLHSTYITWDHGTGCTL